MKGFGSKVPLNTIQPGKCADLIGFIMYFMNQAAAHLAAEGGLLGVVQSGRF